MDSVLEPLDNKGAGQGVATGDQGMDTGDWTVKQAAELMGVSEKTVRRHVKDGTLKSHRERGKFGEELHVTGIPRTMVKVAPATERPIAETDLLARLERQRREIEDLKWQVGALIQEKRDLEAKMRLLEAPSVHRPWWRRLWARVAGH